MKFLTLVEIEIKKLFPILCVLLGGGTLLISGLLFQAINSYKEEFLVQTVGMSVEEFVNANGVTTLANVLYENSQFLFIFILIAIVLVFSGFYLWYKEWFGQSKRIYMLLTLKGSRFTIFLSKLTVILLAVMIYYGFVLVNLGIGELLMNVILPQGLVGSGLVRGALLQYPFMGLILPLTIPNMLYQLGFVIMMFSILSTFIMFDRSKRIWGMVFGTLYGASTVAIYFKLQMLNLYSDERLFVNWSFVLVVTFISTVISAYLLNKKVSI